MTRTSRPMPATSCSRRVAGLGALSLLAGCLGPATPTRFYVLDSQPGPEAAGAVTAKLSIGIAPIDLPDYLAQ
jgi:uncharacterized lipoprotein YmbA